jgi:3-oxoacyl-[acyl-carrier-protein] synthase III
MKRCGITGRGYAIPRQVRHNTDPVFTWLKTYSQQPVDAYFYGYDTRYVLANDENIVDVMANAAMKAMNMANLDADEVDLLIGFVSVSKITMPNELARIHQILGLGMKCWIVPINTEFSNFNASIIFADALINSGRVANALIVCGSNWTQHVDYHSPASVSAGDGAGAAVIQTTDDLSCFRIVDYETITDTSNAWGHMMMTSDPAGASPTLSFPSQGGALASPGLFTQPFFHIDDHGLYEFKTFGVHAPIEVVNKILQRNALTSCQVTVISHQPSLYLLEKWKSEVQPCRWIDSLSMFANMTLASIPFNLAHAYADIETDYLILLGIGPELHSNGLLLRRNG